MRVLFIAVVLLIAGSVFSSETTHRPLEEVISWAGTIAVVEVDESAVTSTVDRVTAELTVSVIEVLIGEADPGDVVQCSYTCIIPEIRNEEGEVIGSVSISVFGSGQEFQCSQGDTVIAFLEPMTVEPETSCGLVRIELMDSRKAILKLLVRAGRIQLS
jgi:hypothetical protein